MMFAYMLYVTHHRYKSKHTSITWTICNIHILEAGLIKCLGKTK